MKQEREQKLISRLSAVQEMSLGDAMALLDISESTARRMFAKLESDGYAIRVHGGLKSLSSHPREERPLRLSLMTADCTFGGGQKAPDPTDII